MTYPGLSLISHSSHDPAIQHSDCMECFPDRPIDDLMRRIRGLTNLLDSAETDRDDWKGKYERMARNLRYSRGI